MHTQINPTSGFGLQELVDALRQRIDADTQLLTQVMSYWTAERPKQKPHPSGGVTLMNTREIKVCIEKEPALYDELFSAMMECREYDGCGVIQYSESEENGWTVALFTLRDAD